MKIDEIKLMYEYNYWANACILNACTNVSPDQYIAPNSYMSLRDTLIHTLDAERSWREAFGRHFIGADISQDASEWQDGDEITEVDVPTVDALKERWQSEERAMRAYLDRLSDGDLNGIVRYIIPGGIVRDRVLWHCLLHLVNHGTQHRSEAAALLTGFGHSPGGLDMTLFLNEHFELPS